MSNRASKGSRSISLLLGMLSMLALGVACAGDDGADGISEADRSAIRDVLAGYLPAMAEAYRTGNVEVLRDHAVEKEIATIYKRISDLMAQEGRIVDSELQSFEVEDMSIWNYSNAFATTMEIWDVRVLASGSETVLSEALDQRNRVRYQLKRTDDGWRVIYRERQQEFED